MTTVGKKAATSWEELGKRARVRVSLAGRMRVESGDLAVDETRFPGRQARLVFAYLVAERSRPVPRDELADAIWGETPPPTWEKALIGIVSKLRTLLTELWARRNAGDHQRVRLLPASLARGQLDRSRCGG
jgi:DNA-binding SARP family transcriptional activator